ncbi:MAG: non-homologous end-joining DNA ligase [Planctomycetota bacterium]|jgi:bifunctional non-homologous end joining protein LigD
MPAPLDDYAKKRDFARTPEPAGRKPEQTGKELVFVVHRHEARQLHYDLRLELDGVLVSFAVPKGFSYNPQEKRLAVQTEDHPMEYEQFSGVIPKGEYGAGAMTIWDHGHYRWAAEPSGRAAITKGELKLRLHGRKLRGEWHLVKLKKGKDKDKDSDKDRNWLLFKSRDRYAGSERDTALGVDISAAVATPLPESVEVMTPGAVAKPFTDPGWLFEMAFAGRRVLAEKRGDNVVIRGIDVELPPGLQKVVSELGEIGAENALLDGVLVALDANERPSAEVLEHCLQGDAGKPIYYYAQDLVYYDEFDMRPLSLVDRKGALRAILPPLASVLYVDHVAGSGESLAEAVAAAGLTSMVAKRADSPYLAGPSASWRRIPLQSTAGAAELGVTAALSRIKPRRQSSRVKLSNLEKVYWPADGFTKGDMLAYYEQVADHMLPHLQDRPVHMNRFPDGIDGKSFYQKEAKEGTPDWIETVPIDSGSRGATVPYTVCGDKDTLLYLANLGSIDLHPWLSRRQSLDAPDWAVLDLDPKSAPFGHVITIARRVAEVLQEIGIRPYLKTSGKTGLHIYIPLEPGYTYEHSRMFCEGVARLVAKDLGDIATVERVLGSREGKVYVDFLQNRRGQTVVPPYCIRPVRGATVSTPLAWDALTDELHPSQFTIQTVLPRISRYGDLFAPVRTDPQDLLPAIEALQSLLKG